MQPLKKGKNTIYSISLHDDIQYLDDMYTHILILPLCQYIAHP